MPAQGLSIPVDLIFDGPSMSPKIEALTMKEIAPIWAAYGVDVQVFNSNEVGRDSAVRLVVMFDYPVRRVSTGVLGSILFRDGVPQPRIVMYPNAIAALISTTTINGSTDRQWPKAFQEMIVGRVLGRALAHEIGHFLLRSRQHSAIGLMRASHPARDLVGPNRHHFFLSADEETRLLSLASLSFQPTAAAMHQVGRTSR